ncbi:MAG TPA: hypothetical protein VK608_11485, partial [Edaphobacter sp.]|nr:hypothetical protein [Edaphobacter sp.]
MNPEERFALFEAGELLGNPSASATQCGVDCYTASFAWQHECKRLASLPAEELEAVYEMSQHLPVEYVMQKYPYTKAEIMRICRIWKARVESAMEAFEALVERFKEYALQGSVTGNIYDDARHYIHSALEALRDTSWQAGRYPKEFTSEELADGKARSDYGWIYQTLRAMPADLLIPCFGEAGEKFMDACERTFAQRKRRRREYLAG